MPRGIDYAVAGAAFVGLAAAAILPGVWAQATLGVWTFGLAAYLVVRRRAKDVERGAWGLRAGEGPRHGDTRTRSTSVALLEVRFSQALLSRCDDSGSVDSATNSGEPAPPFPLATLCSVLDAEFAGFHSLVSWNLCSFPMRVYPKHRAAHAYTELLGPLRVNGRQWHVLELHFDAALLVADSGTVGQAASAVRARVQGLLAHAGFTTRLIADSRRPDLRIMWDSADRRDRLLVSARRDRLNAAGGFTPVTADEHLDPGSPLELMTSDAPPAQGAGPIIGADENDFAVCADFCGPHVATAVLAGHFESLEFLIARMCALGWRAVAISDDPDRWHGLAVAAGVDVLFSQVTIDAGRGLSRPAALPGASGAEYDVVLWDSGLEVPATLLSRGGATVCQMLAGDGEDIERRFAHRGTGSADIVIDGRVDGWFTISTRADISGRRPRSTTVQAVETAAEISALADGRAAPKPFETLTV